MSLTRRRIDLKFQLGKGAFFRIKGEGRDVYLRTATGAVRLTDGNLLGENYFDHDFKLLVLLKDAELTATEVLA